MPRRALAASTEARAQALPTPKDLASGLDLECYRTPGPALNINLTHLNPVLVNLGLPAHQVVVRELVQTCAPVRKNAQALPQAYLDRIRWIDLEKLRASPSVLTAPVNVLLRHLNPLFVNLPQVQVTLHEATSLLVPVAKNGQIPPND